MRGLWSVIIWFLVVRGAAFAHGVYPQTISVVARHPLPEQLVAGTTFGALVSRDSGRSWEWICEEAIGSGTNTPSFHVTDDGTLFAASFNGLHVSRNAGCDWAEQPEFVDSGAAEVHSAPGSNAVFAVTSRYGITNRVWRSLDGGRSFQATSLARDEMFFSSVRVAPSKHDRIYVGGWWFEPAYSSWLFVSDDGGETFQARDLSPAIPGAGPLMVRAVHPAEADTVFASVDASGTTARTHLLRSFDAGASFQKVLETSDRITSVVVAPDGQRVWVATAGQLYRSDDGGGAFVSLLAPLKNACAYLSSSKLYSCGWSALDGWAVGVSDDWGDSFRPLLRWGRVAGALGCSDSSQVTAICRPLWHAQRAQLPAEAPIEEPDGGDGEDGGATPEASRFGCACQTGGPATLGLGMFVWLCSRRRKL